MAKPRTPPVQDIHLDEVRTTAGLLDAFARMGGFTPKSVADAVDLLRQMRKDGARVLLSIPAAPFATGLRGIVVDLVEKGLVHGIITTGGTLDHDLARTWGAYHHGSFQLDDAELHRKGVHRLGSVLVPRSSYGELLEDRLREPLQRLFAKTKMVGTRELCDFLGAELRGHKNRAESLLFVCHLHKVPIFIPGPTDGSVGSQVWMRYQMDRKIGFDLLKDEQELDDLVRGGKKLGAVILGGGISKHHLIWWAQFRGGLDYAVAVTTAVEYDGSLSGARMREAVSWGKLKEKAKHVTIEGDVTLILPLLASGWAT